MLTGELEPTNDAYAIAKIAGIKMCESYNDQYKTNYKCLMPTNTFGPKDKYDDLNSHFVGLAEGTLKNSKKELGTPYYDGLKFKERLYMLMI